MGPLPRGGGLGRAEPRLIGADALVAVYRGSELASLTPLDCAVGSRAVVEFTAHAGVPYHLQVAALSYSTGTVTLSLYESSTDPSAR